MRPSRSSTTRIRCSRSSARTRQSRQPPAAALRFALLGDERRLLLEPDELRVAVREARAGGRALVDERVDVGEARPRARRLARACQASATSSSWRLPRSAIVRTCRGEWIDDLLAADRRPAGEEALGAVAVPRPGAEGRELVRDDPDAPARRVRRPPGRAERERLGRGRGLPPLAERAAGRVVLLVDAEPALRARPPRPRRRDDHPAAGHRVVAELGRRVALGQPVSPVPLFRKGASRSIGSGRISVDERSELISSIVCR